MTTPRLSVLAWNPGDKLIDREGLRAMPPPTKLGSRHKPVPHIELVEAIEAAFDIYGFELSQEQLVVNKTGAKLFGGGIVTPVTEGTLADDLIDYQRNGQAFAVVFRSGNDGHVAIRLAAGRVAFICSNLDIHADFIALQRRHTVKLNLERELEEAVERYVGHTRSFVELTDRAGEIELTDDDARLITFKVFERGLVLPRLFPQVVKNYFNPDEGWADCWPDTRLGLHGAFTRALRSLAPEPKLKATRNVARILLPDDPELN